MTASEMEEDMIITIAGERKEVNEGITITQLIASENIASPEYVSVSVNDDFLARDAFDVTALKEGDAVEFLYFMGGGSDCY